MNGEGDFIMQNQESYQLSLFDFTFEEADQVIGGNQPFIKNDINQFENDNEKIKENLWNEALQLNTSNIFEFEKTGNKFLGVDEFGRKQQSFDRVKELLSICCIKMVIDDENKNSKKADTVEELISILNNVFKQSSEIFNKGKSNDLLNLGEKGQKEYLLTRYLSNVESRILRDFIKKNKHYAPITLVKLIDRVAEFESKVSTKVNKEPSELSNDELANAELMKSMVTSHFFAKQFSQLYRFLGNSETVEFTHQTKESQTLDHPFVNLYVKDLKRRNRSDARIEKMISQIKNLLVWLPTFREFQEISINDISVWEITREHLVEYKAHLIRQSKIGVYTKYNCKQHLKDIKTFFKRLFELNVISENIGLNISNIQASDYFFRKLPSDDDIRELFTAIEIYSEEPDKDTLAFALISFLGFRIIELHRIRWEDINLSTKTLVVHSKGNKSHLLPIPDVIDKIICKIPVKDRNGFIFRKSGQEKEKSFKSRIENAFILYKILADWDLEGGPHLLRHWFITNLARKKIAPVDIRTLARHDSLKTTSKYIHYYSSELRESINKIDYEVSL